MDCDGERSWDEKTFLARRLLLIDKWCFLRYNSTLWLQHRWCLWCRSAIARCIWVIVHGGWRREKVESCLRWWSLHSNHISHLCCTHCYETPYSLHLRTTGDVHIPNNASLHPSPFLLDLEHAPSHAPLHMHSLLIPCHWSPEWRTQYVCCLRELRPAFFS